MDPFASITGSTGAFPGRHPGRLPPYTPSTLPTIRSAAPSTGSPLPRPGTVPTRFLLLSDTHNKELFPKGDEKHAFRSPLPRADVLLHAGDLSNSGSYGQLRKTFDILAAADAELKLVIAGNHDLTLDPAYATKYLTRAARRGRLAEGARKEMQENAQKEITEACKLWTGAEAKAANVVYLEEGVHQFTLSNGACFSIYASPYSVEFMDWAFMYPSTEDRWNPSEGILKKNPEHPIPDFPHIDILMTHGPPHQILDRVGSLEHVGCQHLTRALARVRPRLHVFGHIHEDWGAIRLDWENGRAEYLELGTGDDQEVRERGYVEIDLAAGKRKEEEKEVVAQGGEEVDVKESDVPDSDEGKCDSMPTRELQWGKETICVNAAIMDARFRPLNAPWLVDLMLPAQEARL